MAVGRRGRCDSLGSLARQQRFRKGLFERKHCPEPNEVSDWQCASRLSPSQIITRYAETEFRSIAEAVPCLRCVVEGKLSKEALRRYQEQPAGGCQALVLGRRWNCGGGGGGGTHRISFPKAAMAQSLAPTHCICTTSSSTQFAKPAKVIITASTDTEYTRVRIINPIPKPH
jgi:hypothetical protein